MGVSIACSELGDFVLFPCSTSIGAGSLMPLVNQATSNVMEEHEYIAKAKSHLKGTVGDDETPPSPDDFPQVSVRETVLVDFKSEDRKRWAFVLLDRATGDFVAGGSHGCKR